MSTQTIPKAISIKEYDFLHFSGDFSNDGRGEYINEEAFKQIETFVLDNQEHSRYLKLCTKYGHKVLQAQNFVGLIQTREGTTIEILPKIHQEKSDIDNSKQILISMLKTLRKSPFRNSQFANLKHQKMPLLEIFISMFLEELNTLVKKGIRANYLLTTDDHSPFLKGKLKISSQIKYNSVNASRFAIEYEEFTYDILPNRLIKSTLDFLTNKTHTTENQRQLQKLKFIFDEVTPSYHHRADFERLQTNRHYIHYQKTLSWCQVFLLGSSFTSYRGSSVAWALLFDMNLLFESYVAHCLKKDYSSLNITTQDKGHHLAYQHKNGKLTGRFGLKPDIVISGKNAKVILDTKWKILDSDRPNDNISQTDMYQMYAYAHKYSDCKEVHLIYPEVARIGKFENTEYSFDEEQNKKLKVFFFNVEKGEMANYEEYPSPLHFSGDGV